ncbi:hypothetical protein PISMIDRAFT_15474 [Pisolithus microcarpus 441]|uniref:Uncharacterized protein n=1 Tax=Pisolithus microcarpus 441 TaxID=765257 RepID=A0A0C9ZAE6_9AGAM|nr:hypothetical protein PISMIDRAFT_15474 [Pisolithus microcarpus 441]
MDSDLQSDESCGEKGVKTVCDNEEEAPDQPDKPSSSPNKPNSDQNESMSPTVKTVSNLPNKVPMDPKGHVSPMTNPIDSLHTSKWLAASLKLENEPEKCPTSENSQFLALAQFPMHPRSKTIIPGMPIHSEGRTVEGVEAMAMQSLREACKARGECTINEDVAAYQAQTTNNNSETFVKVLRRPDGNWEHVMDKINKYLTTEDCRTQLGHTTSTSSTTHTLPPTVTKDGKYNFNTNILPTIHEHIRVFNPYKIRLHHHSNHQKNKAA